MAINPRLHFSSVGLSSGGEPFAPAPLPSGDLDATQATGGATLRRFDAIKRAVDTETQAQLRQGDAITRAGSQLQSSGRQITNTFAAIEDRRRQALDLHQAATARTKFLQGVARVSKEALQESDRFGKGATERYDEEIAKLRDESTKGLSERIRQRVDDEFAISATRGRIGLSAAAARKEGDALRAEFTKRMAINATTATGLRGPRQAEEMARVAAEVRDVAAVGIISSEAAEKRLLSYRALVAQDTLNADAANNPAAALLSLEDGTYDHLFDSGEAEGGLDSAGKAAARVKFTRAAELNMKAARSAILAQADDHIAAVGELGRGSPTFMKQAKAVLPTIQFNALAERERFARGVFQIKEANNNSTIPEMEALVRGLNVTVTTPGPGFASNVKLRDTADRVLAGARAEFKSSSEDFRAETQREQAAARAEEARRRAEFKSSSENFRAETQQRQKAERAAQSAQTAEERALMQGQLQNHLANVVHRGEGTISTEDARRVFTPAQFVAFQEATRHAMGNHQQLVGMGMKPLAQQGKSISEVDVKTAETLLNNLRLRDAMIAAYQENVEEMAKDSAQYVQKRWPNLNREENIAKQKAVAGTDDFDYRFFSVREAEAVVDQYNKAPTAQKMDVITKAYAAAGRDGAHMMQDLMDAKLPLSGSTLGHLAGNSQAALDVANFHAAEKVGYAELKRVAGPDLNTLKQSVRENMRDFRSTVLGGNATGAPFANVAEDNVMLYALWRMDNMGEGAETAAQRASGALYGNWFSIQKGYRVPIETDSNAMERQNKRILQDILGGGGVPARVTFSRDKIIGQTDDGRPIVENPDGRSSTHRTMTVEMGGKHFVLPTMFGGRQYSMGDALQIMRENDMVDPDTLNEIVGFDTEEEAIAFDKKLHDDLRNDQGVRESLRLREIDFSLYLAGLRKPTGTKWTNTHDGMGLVLRDEEGKHVLVDGKPVFSMFADVKPLTRAEQQQHRRATSNFGVVPTPSLPQR